MEKDVADTLPKMYLKYSSKGDTFSIAIELIEAAIHRKNNVILLYL